MSVYHPSEIPQLPESARKLVEWIGLDSALKLIRARGGRMIYIPISDRLGESHCLVGILGREDAEKLCRFYLQESGANGQFLVPLCPGLDRDAVRREAIGLFRQGLTYDALAERFGVHERTIRRWVEKAEAQRNKDRTLDWIEEMA